MTEQLEQLKLDEVERVLAVKPDLPPRRKQEVGWAGCPLCEGGWRDQPVCRECREEHR